MSYGRSEENSAGIYAMTARKPTLKDLNRNISPHQNPLMGGTVITSKERRVSSGMRSELVDPDTGEVQAISSIHRVRQIDDAQFVKVFSEGVKAMYGLTRTGMRVFQSILNEYQDTKMNGGYVDAIYLNWFDGGLCGRDVEMSERTFHNGLKELLENKFLAPKSANLYWVNPALFFKGDRVALIREYRRMPRAPESGTVEANSDKRLQVDIEDLIN